MPVWRVAPYDQDWHKPRRAENGVRPIRPPARKGAKPTTEDVVVPPDTLQAPGTNRLLAALPPTVVERLRPDLERVSVSFRQQIYTPDAPIPYVYFPLDSIFSLVIIVEGGAIVEVATVGNEGMVGLPVFLGASTIPGEAFCQIPGEACRMRADALRAATGENGPLRDLLQCYTQALINQIAQSVACNHLHSLQERMCRWLLMTQDRVGADQFPMTQEFLAQMLGVRRPTVTGTASILQKAGLISFARGRLTVLDRRGLEAGSCECYRVVRKEFDRLLL
jgi:CRP-like cAMP-binding protein